MPIDVHPARQGRRPEQIIAEQKARAVRANAQKTVAATAVMPPTKTNSTAVATPVLDTRTTAQKYVDEIAPASIVGRLIKFGKEGMFVTADDGGKCSTERTGPIAMDLNPSFAPPFAQYGLALTFCGRGSEALPYFDKAERISPKDPFSWLAWFGRGWAYHFLGKFEEAASSAKRAIQGSVTHVWGYVILAAALSSCGKSEELRYALDDLFGAKKDFSLTFVEQTAPMDKERRTILIDALRKAGVPN